MSDYFVHLSFPGFLVFAAAAIQATALLFRGQIRIRVLLLVGSGVYLAYYMLATAEPLWEAMIATIAMALANIYGLLDLLLGNKIRSIPSHQVSLFSAFAGVDPDEFRLLMRYGEIIVAPADRFLTRQGDMPENLYYVIEGDVDVHRETGCSRLSSGHFIGETSLMLGTPSPATVCVRAGAHLVVWPRQKLLVSMERHPKLKAAMTSLLGRDMARKLAVAGPRKMQQHQPMGTAIA